MFYDYASIITNEEELKKTEKKIPEQVQRSRGKIENTAGKEEAVQARERAFSRQ